MVEVVAKFDEPGADKETSLTPAEERRQKERQGEVAELVAKMNDCGAPPKEIMGELPPGECPDGRPGCARLPTADLGPGATPAFSFCISGMDLGSDGIPKMPEDCIIS